MVDWEAELRRCPAS